MAKQTPQTIKSWFTRGAKPTQQQFSDVFDSYVHKDETIPQEKVEHLGETLNQLQESVTTALENSIENVTVNGTPVKKTDKSVNIVIPQSDWNQNDETADDYIKNRICYEETVKLKSFENPTARKNGNAGDFPIEIGKFYNVKIDDTIYENKECIRYQPTYGQPLPGILLEGTGNNLGDKYINYYSTGIQYQENGGDGTVYFYIEEVGSGGTIIKQLDEKFIPETIARKTEVPDAPAMIANHNVSEDAHDDIRQMALGASRATSFTNIQTLVTALNTASVEAYRVGDNLYIDTINVADLWVAAVDSDNVPYSYTSDDDFDTAVSAGRVQIGYYFVSRLESGKVNIDLATRTSNGMMSSNDKTKLDGIVHGATKINRGSGFTKNSGWCMGVLNIWNEPHEAGYYSSPDDIIQIYAPDVKVTNGTISANEDGVIDLSAAVAGEIAAAVGSMSGTLRGEFGNSIGLLAADVAGIIAPTKSQQTELVAGGFCDFGVLAKNIVLSLPAITEGTAPEFNGQFIVDANGVFTVAFPASVTMNGDTDLEAGGVYQFSICNGYGVIVKMA